METLCMLGDKCRHVGCYKWLQCTLHIIQWLHNTKKHTQYTGEKNTARLYFSLRRRKTVGSNVM